MTDYVARLVRFDGGDTAAPRSEAARRRIRARPDPLQGIFFSAATDVPGGFDDEHLKQVGDALPYLALAVKSRSTLDVARTLLETYLGADAGGHVLTGEIDRHSVQRIRRSSGSAICAAFRASRAGCPRRSWSRSSTRTSRRWRVRCSTIAARS